MEGPVRFRCPPEFEAVAPSPLPRGSLGSPSTKLWLIRAPADFHPESLEGRTVPLDGCGQLQPDGDGDARLYGVRAVPGGAGSTLLLVSDSPAGPLACAPPLYGSLVITERFGPPPGIPVTVPTPDVPPAKRKKKKKKKKTTTEPLEVPEVSTPGRAAPGEEGERGPGPPQDVALAPGELEVPKKKKKKKKHKRERPE
ncbi:DNA-directed RNA polymerase I subunit RPA34-like [Grus japonensis]|uniref:DNA-directed RNA polymerase I subunit RPA34-like n=1 Tax=Grus japonensis TaxID=30415 RepID=A0ABC9Y873_GRUJA